MRLVVDFDQPIYVAAGFCQSNYDYHHKETGAFAGSYTTQKSFVQGLAEGDSPANYNMDRIVKPIQPKDGSPAEAVGYHNLKIFVNGLLDIPGIDDVTLVIHKEGNFREDVATIQPYKGQRKEKPIFVNEMKEYVKKKWPDMVEEAVGEESDDVVARYGWEAYNRCEDKQGYSDIDTIIAHVDKDLNQVPGIHYNYDKKEKFVVSLFDAAYSFWSQMLTGDSIDNIPGIPKLSKEFKKEHGLRTNGGFGPKTIEKYFADCETSTDLATKVVVAYKEAYGENWLTVAEEVSKLLYMVRTKGEMFSFEGSLNKLGVEYKEG